MKVVNKIVKMSHADDADLIKIGAWLDMKGILKKNKDIRRKWWYHAIICTILQLYPTYRIWTALVISQS